MRPYRRQFLALLLLLGIAAVVAQIAGVGATKSPQPAHRKAKVLATLPGSAVPDIGSTKLMSASMRAKSGSVVRMRSTASVRITNLPRGAATVQVVCGIRYSRDGDASWTIGTPFETVLLTRKHPREHVVIERSFDAPASDRYRMSTTCHVAAPSTGAKVTATGTLRVQSGLPSGAAVPVS